MSCIVYFDNYHGHYMPGDPIVGRVVCTFHAVINCREIRLKLRGKEHTSWTKSESYYDSTSKSTKTRTVHYSGNNKFYAVQVQLEPEGNYPPGVREYPFTFNLPRDLPGCFENHYGWIRYEMKATVDIPWAPDYEDIKGFDLVAPIDFNIIRDQLTLHPTQYSDDKTVCCCWCASGPITMEVYMEKEAYVPGEVMKVKVELTNMSNISTENLLLELVMTIESITTSPSHDTKHDSEIIARAQDTGVGAHGARTYDMELEIPNSTPIPNFTLCTLFQQWTNLRVEACIPGCHSNLDLEVGIKMGNIPITVGNYPAPMYSPAALPPYPAAAPQPNDKPPSYPAGPGFYPGNNSEQGFEMMDGPSVPFIPPPGASGPNAPLAPPDQSGPSAPSKAAEANAPPEEQHGGPGELPPPTYRDDWEKPTGPLPKK